MITYRTIIVFGIAVIFGVALSIPATIHASALTLKLATMAPEGSIWMQEIDLLNKDLETATNGSIKIKVYPGGIMGDDDVVLRKIRVGQLDGALFTTNALSKMNSDIYVLTYPGIFKTSDEVDYYLDRQSGYLFTSLQSKGYEVLGMMSLGFTYTYTTVPIEKIEDMKNAKAWLWDNDPVMTAMYSHLGVTPIAVGIGDVMTALQTGLLNTVFNTPTGIVSLQWFTRVREMIDLPLTHSFGAFVLKSQTWEKIPDDVRLIVRDLVQKHALEITRKTREEDQKARGVISGKNVSIKKPGPELTSDLQKVFGNVVTDLQKDAESAEFFRSVSDTLTEYRTAHSPS
ncbi:TRAP transporter substrate-binding protein DctP [bacterium]|nr:TRAP transporter substrate-binding protein DctP [candidate division CSSED10-310 bacterium]